MKQEGSITRNLNLIYVNSSFNVVFSIISSFIDFVNANLMSNPNRSLAQKTKCWSQELRCRTALKNFGMNNRNPGFNLIRPFGFFIVFIIYLK